MILPFNITASRTPLVGVREEVEANTILLVEDDIELAELTKERLGREGFHVLQEENGELARNLIIKEQPDLVVLDIMLPTLDGLQLCSLLRSDPETQNIRILMLTAKGEEVVVVVVVFELDV